MTIDEINAEMSKPQNEGRVAVLVREDHNELVAARDAYLADVWDAGWHEHYLEMDRQKHDRFHPITKTNPYRNGGTK